MSQLHAYIHYGGHWDLSDPTCYLGEDLTVVLLKEYSFPELRAAIASVLEDSSGMFNVYGITYVFAMAKNMRLPMITDASLKYYVDTFRPPHIPSFWVVKATSENLFGKQNLPSFKEVPKTPPNTKDGGTSNLSPATPASIAGSPLIGDEVDNPQNELLPTPTTPTAKLSGILQQAAVEEPPIDIPSPSVKRKLEYEDENTYPIKRGGFFPTKKVLKLSLEAYAATMRFEYKVHQSSKVLYVCKCFYYPSCKWYIRATKVDKAIDYFEIRSLVDKHTCEDTRIEPLRGRSKPRVLARIVDKKLRIDGVCTPNALIQEAQNLLGVTLNYHQAYRGCNRGMDLNRGDPDESYYHLISYSYMIEALNPGSLACVHTDDKGRFLYSFMALGVCIQAFKDSLRPVIAVDGTVLCGKRGGILLTAVCVDANEQVYPLAVGIVDSENRDACTWFFKKLREALQPEAEILFVSDRSGGINGGLSTVFPDAEHVFCIYHISKNLTKYGKGAAQAFMDAAQSYNEGDFSKHMDRLRERSSKAAKEVEDMGYASWARVKARKPRFSVMTTNIAESFNSVLLKVKSYPVVHIMEFVRRTLNEWFNKRKTEAGAWTGILSPHATKVIKKRNELVKPFHVCLLSGTRFEVVESPSLEGHVVNLEERSCSCGTFDMEFLPCIHALAVINKNDKLLVSDYCGDYWRTSAWRSAYQGITLESPLYTRWDDIPIKVKNRTCTHPGFTAPPGRPRRGRCRGWNEQPKPPANPKRRCGTCGKVGHYSSTCGKSKL